MDAIVAELLNRMAASAALTDDLTDVMVVLVAQETDGSFSLHIKSRIPDEVATLDCLHQLIVQTIIKKAES
jgi:hypothetical protein